MSLKETSSPENWINICDIDLNLYENILVVIKAINLIFSDENYIYKEIEVVKNNILKYLDEKSYIKEKILCSNIEEIIKKLEEIKKDEENQIVLNSWRLKIRTIKYTIVEIKRIKRDVNKREKLVNKKIKEIKLINNAKDLMDFYINFDKNSYNKSRENIRVLKKLIEKFNELKEEIKWTKYNINRINKLKSLIKNVDNEYILSIDLVEYIKKL